MLIYTLAASSINEKWTPLEAIAIVKVMDEEGKIRLCFRHTNGLSDWEMIGMLKVTLDTCSDQMSGAWEEHEDDTPDE